MKRRVRTSAPEATDHVVRLLAAADPVARQGEAQDTRTADARSHDAGPAGDAAAGQAPGPDPFADPVARALFERIVSGQEEAARAPVPLPGRPRRLRRLLLAPIALLAVAAGLLVDRPPDEPLTVACHDTPSVEASAIVVGADLGDPITACTAVWAAGALGPVEQVPPLVTCTRRGGTLVVLPGDSQRACARAGLDAAPEDLPVPTALVVQEAVLARFGDRPCVPVPEAVAAAHAAVVELDLPSWRVLEPEPDQGGGCAALDVDAGTQTVRVVALPSPQGAAS